MNKAKQLLKKHERSCKYKSGLYVSVTVCILHVCTCFSLSLAASSAFSRRLALMFHKEITGVH